MLRYRHDGHIFMGEQIMEKYRLVNVGWRNNFYPYYVAVAVCSKSGEIIVWQQVSKHYFSKWWARRWAKTHGIKLQN